MTRAHFNETPRASGPRGPRSLERGDVRGGWVVRACRLTLVWAAVLVVGCFSSKPPPVMQYFRLPLWEGVKPQSAESVPAVVQVETPDVQADYDHLRIVYRVSAVQLRHYRLRQWVTKPDRLFKTALHRYLQATRLFQAVTSQSRPMVPNYLLRSRIVTLEQVEEGSQRERWYAHVVVELSLHRAKDGHVVWQSRIDEKTRVRHRTPQQVVSQLTSSLRQGLTAALPGLAQAVRQDLARK